MNKLEIALLQGITVKMDLYPDWHQYLWTKKKCVKVKPHYSETDMYMFALHSRTYCIFTFRCCMIAEEFLMLLRQKA